VCGHGVQQQRRGTRHDGTGEAPHAAGCVQASPPTKLLPEFQRPSPVELMWTPEPEIRPGSGRCSEYEPASLGGMARQVERRPRQCYARRTVGGREGPSWPCDGA
jgi:hypothetical protein